MRVGALGCVGCRVQGTGYMSGPWIDAGCGQVTQWYTDGTAPCAIWVTCVRPHPDPSPNPTHAQALGSDAHAHVLHAHVLTLPMHRPSEAKGLSTRWRRKRGSSYVRR